MSVHTGDPRSTTLTALAFMLLGGAVVSSRLNANEPRELLGHQDAVFSVEFSPDGQTLASGSYDKTVKLWDVSSGRVLATFAGHEDQVYRISFSPDGSTLASCSADGTIRIWDVRSRTLKTTLKGHQGPVLAVSHCPTGRLLATAAVDATVRLWDTHQGQLIRAIEQSQPVYSVVFGPKSKTLASGIDGQICFSSVDSGDPIGKMATDAGVIYQLVYSPNGQWLASAGSKGTASVWNVGDQKLSHSTKAESSALFTVAVSPDSAHLATGGRDRVVRLWSLPDLAPHSELSGPEETILSVAYSADGKQIASGSYDAKIHLWALDSP